MLAPAPVHAALRLLLTAGVLTAMAFSIEAWIVAIHARQSAGATGLAFMAPLGAVLLVAAALRLVLRPKRALRETLLAAAAAGILLALASGRRDLVVASAVGLVATFLASALWPEPSDLSARGDGWRLLLTGGGAVLALFLVERPGGTLGALLVVILLAALLATTWGLVLLGRNAPLPTPSFEGPARMVYQQHAGAGVSPFALMRDKRFFWSRDGTAFLAYGCRTGVNVILGPGIGPGESVRRLYREFREESRLHGWRIAFYQVSASMSAALGAGRRYRIGSEAILDLKTLTLEGRAMADLRHEVSRGRRNGVAIVVGPGAELDDATRAAMGAIAATWVRRHALGEMSFSVGRRADPPDVPTTVGLAYDRTGRLIAYTTWLWLPARAGVVLDEVRRLPGSPGGTMDLLLYTCLEQFRDNATWASLGLAPIAGAAQAGRLARLEGQLLRGFRVAPSASLFSFKGKFQPRWEPRYIVVERLADWPAAILAAILLHYPAIEQRLRCLVPPLLRGLSPARALSAGLVASGVVALVAATGQSREGQPLYPVRNTVQTHAGLPFTGGLSPNRKPGQDSAGDRPDQSPSTESREATPSPDYESRGRTQSVH